MGLHAKWRKQVKKLRRKRIRTLLAISRDKEILEEQTRKEKSPTYQAWLKEQTVLEEFKAAEEKRLAMQRQKAWQTADEAAMMQWREQQSRIAHAKAEKFKREVMIREEWEREQKKLEEAEEARKKSEDEKKRKQAELLAQIDAYIEGKGDFPAEVNVETQTLPGHPDCPFFAKTGACRFRDSCSRNHTRPGLSKTLLVPNFYDHFGLSTLNHDEYDTDVGLEYEDSETYQHFKEFYKDVLPEFEQCGRVTMFKVCNNEEPHLRGNVYVEFESRRNTLKAYRTFQGRFYAGRRLNVEFANIPSWKNAVCGLFHRQKCPKGKTCNFLHVFRNPDNAFKIQDGRTSSSRRQFSKSKSRSPPRRRSRSRSKEWHWSDGSGSDSDSRKSPRRSQSRLRSKKRSPGRGSDRRRKSRSRSPSSSKSRSRYRDRRARREKDKRRRSQSRSPRRDKKRSKSRSPRRDKKRSRSKSRSPRRDKKRSRSISRSPHRSKKQSRSKSRSPRRDKKRSRSISRSPHRRKKQSRSKSRSPRRDKKRSRSKSRSPRRDKKGNRDTSCDEFDGKTKISKSGSSIGSDENRKKSGKAKDEDKKGSGKDKTEKDVSKRDKKGTTEETTKQNKNKHEESQSSVLNSSEGVSVTDKLNSSVNGSL